MTTIPSDVEAMLDSIEPDIVQHAVRSVFEIAGYWAPEDQFEPFRSLHAWVYGPRSDERLRAVRLDQGSRWYNAFVEGLLSHTKNAFRCIHYHRERLDDLETQLSSVLDDPELRAAMAKRGVGVGNTGKLDFEYQAFVLAVRRCLDLMTRGIAGYFRSEFHSFRELPDRLDRCRPRSIASALSLALSEHYHNFDYVMSEGHERSVRDEITHYSFVRAGHVGFGPYGLAVMGGGENLLPRGGEPLRTVIRRRADHVGDLIRSMFDTIIAVEPEPEERR